MTRTLRRKRGAPWWALLWTFAIGACTEEGVGLQPALGTLERDRIELSSDAFENIVEIAVAEGDSVAVGDLLLRLDSARVEAQQNRARARRAEAEAALRLAVRGPRSEHILEGQARLTAAEGALTTAESQLRRFQDLVLQQIETPARRDELQGRYDQALGNRDEARSALEALVEGTTLEELDQAQRVVDTATTAFKELDIELSRLEIRSPVAGRIDALPFELGERPPPGSTLAVVLADRAVYARIHIPAPVRASLEIGARATIHIDGRDRALEGRLRWVAHEAAFTPYFALTQHDRSRLSYLAEVDVLEHEQALELPLGVPVEVFFLDRDRAE